MSIDEDITIRLEECKKDNVDKTKALQEYKREKYILECKLSNVRKRHTKIVSQLHEHIDKYRKQMITCLNTSVPDMDDQCSI